MKVIVNYEGIEGVVEVRTEVCPTDRGNEEYRTIEPLDGVFDDLLDCEWDSICEEVLLSYPENSYVVVL